MTPLYQYRSERAQAVSIGSDDLCGVLSVPHDASGIVIFAYRSNNGSGSNEEIGCLGKGMSAYVADGLHNKKIATILVDLLTMQEREDVYSQRDMALLASRFFSVTEWVASVSHISQLPCGYFGAGKDAGAAILAASGPDRRIRAIAVHNGRVDMAGPMALSRVRAPVQLIVGSRDLSAVGISEASMVHMQCEKELIALSDAEYAHNELAMADQIVKHAARWFLSHFAGAECPSD